MASHPSRAEPERIVVVPVDLALAYTADREWHYVDAPPQWWMQEQEALAAAEARPSPTLTLVPLVRAADGLRPGTGRSRRRHEHASERRAD